MGAFCIGTNQIDLKFARHQGIPVFNAPYSNTRSVAELVIAQMISLSRQLGDRNTKAHLGEWLKSAKGSYEVRGKTLGIVGYGHIGTQVGVLAEGLGLNVVYWDIIKKLNLGTAHPCSSLQELLSQSDFVTLHVPETKETKNMICKKTLKLMKEKSFLINNSRGHVMNLGDVKDALSSGHLSGVALDVFPEEPSDNFQTFSCELQQMSNVLLTPHIGGSTEEAQKSIGLEVSESLSRFIKTGSSTGAVNFPLLEPTPQKGFRLINIHKNVSGVLGAINGAISQNKANILAQFLATDSEVGYLIMDLDVSPSLGESLAKDVQALETSISTRFLPLL